MIGHDIALAQALYKTIGTYPELQAVTQSLSITTFRFVPPDLPNDPTVVTAYLNQLNQELLNRLQKSGEAFVSNAVVDGNYLLRADRQLSDHLGRCGSATRACAKTGQRIGCRNPPPILCHIRLNRFDDRGLMLNPSSFINRRHERDNNSGSHRCPQVSEETSSWSRRKDYIPHYEWC